MNRAVTSLDDVHCGGEADLVWFAVSKDEKFSVRRSSVALSAVLDVAVSHSEQSGSDAPVHVGCLSTSLCAWRVVQEYFDATRDVPTQSCPTLPPSVSTLAGAELHACLMLAIALDLEQLAEVLIAFLAHRCKELPPAGVFATLRCV